ncbi:hypothetical protein ElyMa_002139500 [Elysia marginata]|uniref:Uncharacterized protein n=1 Tax=Elysia marginata TaxID=1093978 RepID=A0AAV4FLF7_9GAST|nr:hypothetical protein ElyMa_002139500 [Elysia marginata]
MGISNDFVVVLPHVLFLRLSFNLLLVCKEAFGNGTVLVAVLHNFFSISSNPLPSIPANKAMAFYFHDDAKRARGRPITTLPMTLNNDLKILQNRSISLTSQKDLETLRKIAERRQEWITFTADIKKAAEAARSDDTPSGRP